MKLPKPTPEAIVALRQTIAEAQAAGASLAELQAKRLNLCLTVGQTLNSWKHAFSHGRWMPFLSEEFPSITYRTVMSWCLLAQKVDAKKIDIANCYSLREAFDHCDMLPSRNAPAPRKQEPKRSRLAHQYLQHANRLVAALNELKLDTMEQSAKNEVRRRLLPVVKFYESLQSPLPQRKLAA